MDDQQCTYCGLLFSKDEMLEDQHYKGDLYCLDCAIAVEEAEEIDIFLNTKL